MKENTLLAMLRKLTEELPQINGVLENMKPFFDNISYGDFTELQQEVFRSPAFWDNGTNVIVQGSTSSGKTLAAEVSMAYQIYCRRKKVLYLVPLKALTSEKMRAFESAFRDERGEPLRIYSSSSDYQEHDYDLMRGYYDIGILVYEKFFALLAQNSEQFYKDCDLVVVDEMHMLKDSERGPKLEFSIEKLKYLKKDSRDFSFLGLTTLDCDMSKVSEWLGEGTENITNPVHPVTIEERFIRWDSEKEKPELKCFIDREEVACPDFDKAAPESATDDRERLLITILRNHPEDKIIVFCNSKANGERLVKTICSSGVLKSQECKFINKPEGDDCEMDESRYGQFNYALSFGVVYHNANLNEIVRSFIEDNFENGDIRIIIATETLTMGVNLPTDVMIFYDTEVGRKDGKRQMTYQEYRNALGRAGRLGKSRHDKGIGYIIAANEREQSSNIRKLHEEDRPELIWSGLSRNIVDEWFKTQHNPPERKLYISAAPYYLNMIGSAASFDKETLQEIVDHGLYNEEKQSDENKGELAGMMLDLLSGGDKTINTMPKYLVVDEKEDDLGLSDPVTVYQVNTYGRNMAAYALSVYTDIYIQRFFVDEINAARLPRYSEDCRFTVNEPVRPKAGKAEDALPDYFLDVMLYVCKMPEIVSNTTYVSFGIKQNPTEYVSTLKGAIIGFVKENYSQLSFLEKSKWTAVYNNIIKSDNEPVKDMDIIPMLRAMILYYWVNGYSVLEIREALKLPNQEQFFIYSSELSSLGEICAHQLEAISRAFGACANYLYKDHMEMQKQFYNLSIRVKYGMGNELARIASRHIRGLSRSRLIKLGKRMNQKQCQSVYQYITDHPSEVKEVLGDSLYTEVNKVIRRQARLNYQRLVDELLRDGVIDNEFMNYFAGFCSLNNESVASLRDLTARLKLSSISESNKPFLEVSGINIVLCTKHGSFVSSGEVEEAVKAECEEFRNGMLENPVIVYTGEMTFGGDNRTCICRDDFKTVVMRCMYAGSGDSGKNSTAGKYLVEMLKDFSRRGVQALKCLPGQHEQEQEFPAVASAPEVPAVNVASIGQTGGNTIINGDVYITDVNYQSRQWNFTQNNMQITLNINNIIDIVNEYKLTDAALGGLDINSEEAEPVVEQALSEATDKITSRFAGQEKNVESVCRDSYENFDNLFGSESPGSSARFSFCQGFYLKRQIRSIEGLTDYSPAGIMYGKAMEIVLKEKILPLLKRNEKMSDYYLTGNGRTKKVFLKDADPKIITIGDFMHAITFGIKRKKITGSDWKELGDLLSASRPNRNKCAHAGEEVTCEESDVLEQCLIKAIETVGSLLSI
ncbi:MAG: DEAD/DEAH box helicase [Oscillospiraceae bacterium]